MKDDCGPKCFRMLDVAALTNGRALEKWRSACSFILASWDGGICSGRSKSGNPAVFMAAWTLKMSSASLSLAAVWGLLALVFLRAFARAFNPSESMAAWVFCAAWTFRMASMGSSMIGGKAALSPAGAGADAKREAWTRAFCMEMASLTMAYAWKSTAFEGLGSSAYSLKTASRQ
jgi:hypothetical protein